MRKDMRGLGCNPNSTTQYGHEGLQERAPQGNLEGKLLIKTMVEVDLNILALQLLLLLIFKQVFLLLLFFSKEK